MFRIPESHLDLLDADVGVLATVGSDGRPQLSAVWFLADGDSIALSLNTSRQKAKNLKANAAATLFILDRQNPSRYLEVRGDATIEADDNHLFADRVGAKYQTDLRAHDGPNDRRIKVEIRPRRINAIDMAG